MPYQLDPQIETQIRTRLKSEGFTPPHIDTALKMAKSLIASVLVGFLSHVRMDPSEVDAMNIKGADPEFTKAFKTGGKFLVEQYNQIIDDSLLKTGIDKTKDVSRPKP
jgi:hypothetical protein